jgi:hypothetical protein
MQVSDEVAVIVGRAFLSVYEQLGGVVSIGMVVDALKQEADELAARRQGLVDRLSEQKAAAWEEWFAR